VKCPRCSSKTRVKDSRLAHKENARRRKHYCRSKECGYVFHTIEYEQEKDVDHELISASRCVACGEKAALMKAVLLGDRISVQRRYRCLSCGQDTFTVEKPGEGEQDAIDWYSPLVEKKDGTRVPFDRAKLVESLATVRSKHLDEDGFRELVEHIEQRVVPGEVIRSSELRQLALEFLKQASEMAYLKCLIDWGMADTPDELMARLGDPDE